MCTEFDKELLTKYVERNYPVKRYKFNNRFKRAILLDNGHVYFLGAPDVHDKLRFDLIHILQIVFSYEESFINSVLDNFLPLKIRG